MKFDFSCVFFNPLLQTKIFSYLDNRNLGNCRLLCSKLAEDGERFILKRNPYFTLESSNMVNRKIVRATNFEKLKWMEECLKKPEKLWLFERVDLPIKEALQCKEVRDFFQEHGHQIKFLMLTKQDGFSEQLLGIVEECISPFHLLHLILTSWCPNLTSIFVIDYYNWISSEVNFLPWDPQGVTLFNNQLKVESLTINLIRVDIPNSYFKQLMQNCPNLKIVSILLKDFRFKVRENPIDYGIFPDNGLNLLESLEVAKVKRTTAFLQSITQEKFPRMKTLLIEFKLPKELNEFYNCRLVHKMIHKVELITYLHEFPFEVVLQIFPYTEALSFIYKWGLLGENFCKVSGSTYPNIKKILLIAKLGQNVKEVVVSLAQLCPNLELFKVGEISSEQDFSIKSAFEDIFKYMRKINHFDLTVTNYDCVSKEMDELKFERKHNKEGRIISYCVGTREFMRTRCIGPKF